MAELHRCQQLWNLVTMREHLVCISQSVERFREDDQHVFAQMLTPISREV